MGRASFRVITAHDDDGGENVESRSALAPGAGRGRLDRTQPVSLGRAAPQAEPGAPTEQAAWYAPSEPVVLLPPDSVNRAVHAGTGRQPALSMAATQDLGHFAPSRKSTPLWAIAAALFLGATATLSAQAIMKRPPRWAAAGTVPVQAPGAHVGAVREHNKPSSADIGAVTISPAAPIETAASSAGALPLVKAPGASGPATTATAAVPTVVPSTATAPPEDGGPAEAGTAGKRIVTGERVRAARTVVAPPVRARGEAHPAKVVARPATWVDPFADDSAGTTAATASGSGQVGRLRAGRGAATTTRASSARRPPAATAPASPAWVDPFAN